ncbi:putative senescence regulator S40 [Arabidopsis thaliana]
MSEEFDESEIIFSDNYFPIRRREDGNEKENNRPVDFRENYERVWNKSSRRSKTTPLPSAVTAFSSSLPVNIPMRRCSTEEEYSDDDGGRKMIPPHLIVGRRMEGGQMAFSVCTGNGRTLKGRDLSRVRNSVLKLTGFLEA